MECFFLIVANDMEFRNKLQGCRYICFLFFFFFSFTSQIRLLPLTLESGRLDGGAVSDPLRFRLLNFAPILAFLSRGLTVGLTAVTLEPSTRIFHIKPGCFSISSTAPEYSATMTANL